MLVKPDKFYSPIMSCRIVIEVPEHRRKYGGLHHVRIDLGVPGGELVVKHEPSLHSSAQEDEEKTAKHLEVDVPHKKVDVAIRDAFRSARRQLQDYARRQRGDVKIHESQQGQVVELFRRRDMASWKPRMDARSTSTRTVSCMDRSAASM
jgi:hypothetical protein